MLWRLLNPITTPIQSEISSLILKLPAFGFPFNEWNRRSKYVKFRQIKLEEWRTTVKLELERAGIRLRVVGEKIYKKKGKFQGYPIYKASHKLITPIRITSVFFYNNEKIRDIDGEQPFSKYTIDSLVRFGLLPGDDLRYVRFVGYEFGGYLGKESVEKEPYVMVLISGAGNANV